MPAALRRLSGGARCHRAGCKAEVGGSNDPASEICLGKKSFRQANSGAQRVTAKRSGGVAELRFEMIDLSGKIWDTRVLQKNSAPASP